MKRYELIFIVQPELSEEEVKTITDRFLQIITAQKGTLIKTEDWGKRRLAYDINKQSKGTYILVDFYGPGSMIKEIERNLKIDDNILKFLTVKTKDPFDPESLEEERKKEQLLQEAQISSDEPEPIVAQEPGEEEIDSEKEGE
ncbi:MAG: 30S ribosomal protein S6 [Deltaproteobacteria bacterium]|nr:30S ribosomal protein S6 [Deltaproteobacteria bacterium]